MARLQTYRLVKIQTLHCPKCWADYHGVPTKGAYGDMSVEDEVTDDQVAVCSSCGHSVAIRDLEPGEDAVVVDSLGGWIEVAGEAI